MTIQTLPVPAAPTVRGGLRRSLRLEEQLDAAHSSQAQVLLTGAGVNDFLITGTGRVRRLTAFLHGYCEDRNIGYVRYSMSEGIKSYPTMLGDQAIAVRDADLDAHPGQVVRQLLTDLRAGGVAGMFVFDYADSVLDEDRVALEVSLLCEHLQALTTDTAWHQVGLRVVLVDRGGGITPRLARHPGIRTVEIGPPDQAELTILSAGPQRRLPVPSCTWRRPYLMRKPGGARAGCSTCIYTRCAWPAPPHTRSRRSRSPGARRLPSAKPAAAPWS